MKELYKNYKGIIHGRILESPPHCGGRRGGVFDIDKGRGI